MLKLVNCFVGDNHIAEECIIDSERISKLENTEVINGVTIYSTDYQLIVKDLTELKNELIEDLGKILQKNIVAEVAIVNPFDLSVRYRPLEQRVVKGNKLLVVVDHIPDNAWGRFISAYEKQLKEQFMHMTQGVSPRLY